MPKFTFHMPIHDHNAIEVEATDITEARDKLFAFVQTGQDNDVLTIDTHIDGFTYWKEEVWDCPVFNEDGDQLDD